MNYYVDASNQEKAREAARKVIDAAEQLTGVTPDRYQLRQVAEAFRLLSNTK